MWLTVVLPEKSSLTFVLWFSMMFLYEDYPLFASSLLFLSFLLQTNSFKDFLKTVFVECFCALFLERFFYIFPEFSFTCIFIRPLFRHEVFPFNVCMWSVCFFFLWQYSLIKILIVAKVSAFEIGKIAY